MVGLLIANLIAILKAFIRSNLGSSNIPIVDDSRPVMFYKVFDRMRLPVFVVDNWRIGMRFENCDRNTRFE
jgi:hypothetical protein